MNPPRGFVSGVLHIAPAASYVIAIFIGGSLSGGETYVPLTDKQLHAIAFAVMVPLLARALRFLVPRFSLPILVGASALGSSILGALLELWQAILPHRDADVFDWVADTIGAVLAALFLVTLALIFGVIGGRSEGSSAPPWDRSA